jgi:hypothetical protein
VRERERRRKKERERERVSERERRRKKERERERERTEIKINSHCRLFHWEGNRRKGSHRYRSLTLKSGRTISCLIM